MPPFASFTLPIFGHSLEIYMRTEETFVLEKHKKFGSVFGFYLQDLLFFCLDINHYGGEVNSSPKVRKAALPPRLSPIKGPTHDAREVLKGLYARNLKGRLPFVQKQVDSFLHDEFSADPSIWQSRKMYYGLFQRMCACYTLASWFDYDYSQMAKENLIEKVCSFHTAEVAMRDITLVMPRFAVFARLKLKKYRRVVESFLGPLLRNPSESEENNDEMESRSMVKILQNEGISSDILLDTFISMIPGAMSISPTIEHLFQCFLCDTEVLSEAQDEQSSSTLLNGSTITYQTLSEMKFLEASLKETLRLEFTLASYRYIEEDLELHDGYLLPAGSHFILTGAAVNFDESIFPHSHKWNPKRWLALDEFDRGLKSSDSRRRDAFIWGSGKIFCPGRQHALIGMKLISSLILRNFNIRYDDDHLMMSFKSLEHGPLFYNQV